MRISYCNPHNRPEPCLWCARERKRREDEDRVEELWQKMRLWMLVVTLAMLLLVLLDP